MSPSSLDIARVMLFETRESAEAIARHLDSDAVAGGIRVRPACWMAITRAKNPIISLFLAPKPRKDKGGRHKTRRSMAQESFPPVLELRFPPDLDLP